MPFIDAWAVRPVTRYSKYIISIFHWLEEGSVVRLTED